MRYLILLLLTGCFQGLPSTKEDIQLCNCYCNKIGHKLLLINKQNSGELHFRCDTDGYNYISNNTYVEGCSK